MRILSRLLPLGLAAILPLPVFPAAAVPAPEDPVRYANAPNAVKDSYVVVLKNGATLTAEPGGRAAWGVNTTGDGNNSDCHGHGTHVAATIGGTQYGAAKDVRLVAVKVLGCNGSGTTAGVIAGIDWVTRNAARPAVANVSLGAPGSDAALENAVRASIASGVTYVVASGNSSVNACDITPARVVEAITVNAMDVNDNKASFSNFGVCTDLYAPGVAITSAWGSGDAASNTVRPSILTIVNSGPGAVRIGNTGFLTGENFWVTMFDRTRQVRTYHVPSLAAGAILDFGFPELLGYVDCAAVFVDATGVVAEYREDNNATPRIGPCLH